MANRALLVRVLTVRQVGSSNCIPFLNEVMCFVLAGLTLGANENVLGCILAGLDDVPVVLAHGHRIADVNGGAANRCLFERVCGSVGILCEIAGSRTQNLGSLRLIYRGKCSILCGCRLADEVIHADVDLNVKIFCRTVSECCKRHCSNQHDCYQQQAEQLFAKCLHFVFLLIDWNK